MSISSKPIAVFDSGFGGISVLKKLLNILPNENYIYLGDNHNIPYGDKSKEEITQLSIKILDFLIKQNCKMAVIACNTITASSYDVLKEKYNIPIIEIISNGVEDIIDNTKNNNISIMATEFTVHSNMYHDKIFDYNDKIKVTQVACQKLCPMIENNWYSYDDRILVLEEYVKKIDDNSDTLLLACTHYPFIIDDIKSVVNRKKTNIKNIIDPSTKIALSIKKYLIDNNLLNTSGGKLKFFTTGDKKDFNDFVSRYIKINYELERIVL
ncbi:glutamate racemase [Brachyspira pilosicoli]|uniref:glutamate racemase n=1 Tax=Brachyspira pilosicoli TaxID=52584 RepID=UPI000E16E73F|nr:glutamate racemase [Brachyspira pilosicoli]SUW07777.1 glutamate racemase [Brachyspira pilosicoli]